MQQTVKLSGGVKRAGPVMAGVALWLFMLAAPVASYPQSPQLREYELKAAFLFNFARLTEWPNRTSASHKTNFVIGILGDDPFGSDLDMLRNRTIGGRRVLITRISDVSGSSACDLLFVASSEKDRVQQIIARVRNMPVLTVSDIADFTDKGGIIAFFLKDNHVRFRINLDAAASANLTLSSHLLEAADIVERRGKE